MKRLAGLALALLLVVLAVACGRRRGAAKPHVLDPPEPATDDTDPAAISDAGHAREGTDVRVLLAAYEAAREGVALQTAASAGSGSFFLGATSLIAAAVMFSTDPDRTILRFIPIVVWAGAVWGVFQVRGVLLSGLYASMLERRINRTLAGDPRYGLVSGQQAGREWNNRTMLLDEATLWSPLRSADPQGRAIVRYDPLGSAGIYAGFLVLGSVLVYGITILVVWQKGSGTIDGELVGFLSVYAVLALILIVVVMLWLPRDLRKAFEKWRNYYGLEGIVPGESDIKPTLVRTIQLALSIRLPGRRITGP